MIFMSQSGITDPSRESDWDAWYVQHLDLMASVPGISSAQRFKTKTPGHSPSLAMYSVAAPEVFQDPYYLSVRGMGEWLPLIDRQYYKRNLFAGLDAAPEVSDGRFLLVADRDKPEMGRAGIEWIWLECVGIDRSTPYRGIAVVPPAVADRARRHAGIGVYERAGACHKPKR
jgi:hypothetical protein